MVSNLAKIATRNTRKLRAMSNSSRATESPDKNSATIGYSTVLVYFQVKEKGAFLL